MTGCRGCNELLFAMEKNDVLLTLSHVSASYGGKTVLNDVSFRVSQHDFWGVVGPNGGGKTTLVRLMLGLKQPDSGSVTYFCNGLPVHSLSVGYLPQYSHIDRQFPISVREVVLTGLGNKKHLMARFKEPHRQMVDEALRRIELSSMAHCHIASLSGGQLQRVLLARAIVAKPSVLVLDEPNTYMDRHFQRDMYALLHDLNRDCAVVIVSHDLEAVRKHAGHIVYVNRRVRPVAPSDCVENLMAEMP